MNSSQFEYYDGAWNEETQKVKFAYCDNIFHARVLEVTVSDPHNTQQNSGKYGLYTFVRLIERETEEVLFFGRITHIEPKFDDSLGQILLVTCKDMGCELEDNGITADYSGQATPPISDIVGNNAAANIIEDIVYGGYGATPNIRNTKVEASAYNLGSEGPNYSKVNVSAMEAIQDLARRDQRDATHYGYVFRVNNGQTVGGNYAEALYYMRGKYMGIRPDNDSPDGPGAGPATDGLTLAFNESETDQLKAIFPGYEFPNYPQEVYTECYVPYIVDGVYNIETVTFTDGAGNDLEDTIQMKKGLTIHSTGAASQVEAQQIGAAWKAQYDQDSAPNKGTVKIGGYPMYTRGGTTYFVTAGNLVHIHLQMGGATLLTAIHNTDMIVTEIEYKEPEGTCTISLVEKDYGFDDSSLDIFGQIAKNRRQASYASEVGGSFGDGSIPPGALHDSTQPYQLDITFTETDSDTISWGAGTLTYQDGGTLAINAGDTGNMTLTTYIYFIEEDSDLHTSTNFLDAISSGRGLVAACAPSPHSTGMAMVLPSTGKLPLMNAVVMTANFLQSEHIDSKQISFSHMLGNPENLVENGGFEELDSSDRPRGWTSSGNYYSKSDSPNCRTGLYAVECDVANSVKDYYMDYYIPVEQDEIIYFSGYSKWGGVVPNAIAKLGIRQYDKDGNDLGAGSAVYSDDWSIVGPPNFNTPETVSLKVPANTGFVRFLIRIALNGVPTGSWLFDDMSGGKASKIIIQGDPDGAHLIITATGLEAYDPGGVARVVIDAANSILILKEGALEFQDDAGSAYGTLKAFSGARDRLELETENGSGYDIDIDSDNDMYLSADGVIQVNAAGDLRLYAGGIILVKGDRFDLDYWNCPFIPRRFTGNDKPTWDQMEEGEVAIWEDGDSTDVWWVYRCTVGHDDPDPVKEVKIT